MQQGPNAVADMLSLFPFMGNNAGSVRKAPCRDFIAQLWPVSEYTEGTHYAVHIIGARPLLVSRCFDDPEAQVPR